MNFADAVTILRPGADAYGNRASGWETPEETAASAFVPGRRDKAYFPVDTPLQHGDRLRLADGSVHDVAHPFTYRSPTRSILVSCSLSRVEG